MERLKQREREKYRPPKLLVISSGHCRRRKGAFYGGLSIEWGRWAVEWAGPSPGDYPGSCSSEGRAARVVRGEVLAFSTRFTSRSRSLMTFSVELEWQTPTVKHALDAVLKH